METGGNHIGKHAGVYHIDILRKQSQVSVCIIYMEIIGKYAVFEVGEFPACEHSAGVHGVTGLCLEGIPVRSDCRNQNAVAGLKVFYQLSDFHNLCTALMAQDHVVTVADSAFP